MSWTLKGIAGPLKNKTFPVKVGLTLGRKGDLVIPDTKASGIHCRFIEDASGQMVLADNNSKNGTRVKGERISSVVLRDGLVFSIGDQAFQVVEVGREARRDEKPKASRKEKVEPPPDVDLTPPPPTPAKKSRKPDIEIELPAIPTGEITTPPLVNPLPLVEVLPTATPDIVVDDVPVPTLAPEAEPEPIPEPPKPKPKRYWHELLNEFLTENKDKFIERKKPISALNPAVVLEFVRGIQVNSRWVIGYGPRRVGPSALDLPIWEPGAPAICFEIFPSSDGIVFKTNHPDLVKVNGEAVDSRTLRVGDTIRINETLIEVDFEE